MIIINGKKFYANDIRRATAFAHCEGWDSNASECRQWYTLKWDELTNLVILDASGDSAYSDNSTRYFDSPQSFADAFDGIIGKKWSDIFSGADKDTEEEEKRISAFADLILC